MAELQRSGRVASRTTTTIAAVGLFAVVCSVAAAATPAAQPLVNDPGFVDFTRLGLDPQDANLEINLEGPVIRLVAAAVRDEDAGFADLLAGLRSIRVLSFEVEGSPASDATLKSVSALRERAASSARELARQGWRPVFRMRDDEQHIDLYLREVDGVIAGVWVLVLDAEKSLTMVNVVGNLDPAELGRLGSSLHLDPLEVIGRMTAEQQSSQQSSESNKP